MADTSPLTAFVAPLDARVLTLVTESRLNLATPGRVPRLLRETLADIARQPGAAVWAMAPAWVVLGFAHWLFRGFEEGRDVPVFGRYLSLYEEQFVFVLGLYVVATILAVGLIATRWQPLVLGTEPRLGLSPILRYGAEWIWRSIVLGLPLTLITLTPLIIAERVFQNGFFVQAEMALAALLRDLDVPFPRSGELTATVSLGVISSVGVVPFLYLWLRLALGLPAYVATGTPLLLKASWQRSRGFSRALWRAALAGTALWLAIKVIAWSLSIVASIDYGAPDEASWMFAARVAVPPINTALIQLIAAGLLARVYLATEPDPAEVF
ncbi:MAG: hypothetical protein AAF825_03420 [Pseudomonadota bacterium]